MDRSNQKGLAPIVIILLITLLGGGYFIYQSQGKITTPSSQPTPQPFEPSSSAPVSISPASPYNPEEYTVWTYGLPLSSEGFKKRQFDINKKFFKSKNYPDEVINISEENLVGMKCTPRIFKSVGPSAIAELTEEKKEKLLALIKEADKTIDKLDRFGNPAEIYEVTYCQTEDGRQILRYKISSGGGGGGGADYIGLVNPDNTIKRVAKIADNHFAYFGCYNPLQLTKDNILYYNCWGGDGPSGVASIYKISLNDSSVKRLIDCKSGVDIEDKPYLECE